MANEIYCEIFVTREEYTPPIQYVQATNAIPIVVRICDYNIPAGAKANVFVKKPSGKSVQDTAAIDGNTVTIDVKTQMFVEIGISIMQIQITNGQDVLITFDMPVMVRKNRTEPGAPESENEAAFFAELQEAANKARIAAQEANQAAAKLTPEAIFSAVEKYFTEHPVDLDCTPTLEGTTLVFPSGADASGTLTQAVQDLLAFMNKFNGKTIYEEVV